MDFLDVRKSLDEKTCYGLQENGQWVEIAPGMVSVNGFVVNPLTKEHSARVQDPGKFIKGSFRRKQIAPGISVITAKKEANGPMEVQSYRFLASSFSVSEARKWLKSHEIVVKEFAAASLKEVAVSNEKEDKDASTSSFWKMLGKMLGLVSNEISHSSLRSRLSDAVRERFGPKPHLPGAAYYSCYIEDVYDSYVVFHYHDALYSIGYTIGDDDEVTLDEGEPAEVRLVTTYEEVANENIGGDAPPATEGEPAGSKENPMALAPATKGEIIRVLLANCSCEGTPWKGLNEAGLSAIPDDKLEGWHQMVKFLPPPPPAPVQNAAVPGAASAPSPFTFGQDQQGNRYVFNTQTGQVTWVAPPPGQQAPPGQVQAPGVQQQIPVAQPVSTNQTFRVHNGYVPKSVDELAALLPPEENQRFQEFVASQATRKKELVDLLVANSNVDPNQINETNFFYQSKGLPELERLALLLGPKNMVEGASVNYAGAVGGVINHAPVVEPPLESPTYKFEYHRKTG